MSEEIKEFAPVVEEVPVQQAIQFDPNKKYTWNKDASIVISGAEFGQILNALRAITNTQEAKAIFLAAEAGDRIEGVLVRNVENGTIVEAQEIPKGSL